MLPSKRYLEVIRDTQLVAIDLILINEDSKVLLGKRINEPAKGYFFVPGSRIFKNETLHQGVKRVAKDEVGVEFKEPPLFRGVYEHMYPTNFLNMPDISTHYVVVCMFAPVHSKEIDWTRFGEQHSDTMWADPKTIPHDPRVHRYTQAYFQKDALNKFVS